MARNKKECDCGLLGTQDVGDYATLKGRVIHVTVGDEDRPASPEDVEDVEALFAEKLKGIGCRLVVTGHAVKVDIL